MQINGKTDQIFGIDALRFFAACTVMFYHLAYISWASPHTRNLESSEVFAVFRPLAPFVGTGWVGVQIFFVISGFVIAYTASNASAGTFLRRRIVRLGPGVWICASLSVPLLLLSDQPPHGILNRYLASIIFLPLVPHVATSYWTLPVEIVFYGLIWVLLYFRQFRRAEWLAFALGAVSALVWAAFDLRFVVDLGWAGTIAGWLGEKDVGQITLLQHGLFFALGMLIWLVSSGGWRPRRLAAVLGLTGAGLLQLIAETAKSSAWTGYHRSAVLPVLLWLGAILWLGASVRFKGPVARACAGYARPIRIIGLSTYPLYLIHEPLGRLVLLAQVIGGVPPYLALAATAALAIGAAIVIAVYLEPPVQTICRRLLLRFWGDRPQALDGRGMAAPKRAVPD